MKILMSLLMAIMFLGGQAVAEEGDICDGQVGAAFGLCQAYIAMGCDSPEPEASEGACAEVQEQFEQITGTIPPWACPAWTPAELAASYDLNCHTCKDDDEGHDNFTGEDYIRDMCDNILKRVDLTVSTPDDGSPSYVEYWDSYQEIDRAMDLTQPQYDACVDDILSNKFRSCP